MATATAKLITPDAYPINTMKRIIITFLIIIAIVAFFVHRLDTRLFVANSTPRAIKAQTDLKFDSFAASIEAEGGPNHAIGKIDVISFSDDTYHKELMQLHGMFAGFLKLYEHKTGVTLNDRQRFQIARALAVARLSQMLYEAEIAKVDDSNPNLVKISIPAYGDQGNGLHDFLVDKITKNTGDPKLAAALADDMGRNLDHYGAYSQNIEMTQKPESINGRPVTAVMIANTSMAAPGIPMTYGSNYPRGDMHEFTPFEAFLAKQ